MFGAGYLEMLARQMSEELQRPRDSIHVGETNSLVVKGGLQKTDADENGIWIGRGSKGPAA